MQTLAGLAHLDYQLPQAHTYEQAFAVIRALGLSMVAVEDQFRRMAFNLIARNQDDHVKNIAFLMDRDGAWSLAPAYDLTYALNPDGRWTAAHQMSVNGKRDAFELEDLREVARFASMKRGRAEAIAAEVGKAVANWSRFAETAGVAEQRIEAIGASHRPSLGLGP